MSIEAFAIRHGIKVQTFASWIQKRRRVRGDYEDEATRSKLRMPARSRTRANPNKSTSSRTLNLDEVCVNAESSADSASPLAQVAEEKMRLDPKFGAPFVFSNRSRNRFNILYWDGNGMQRD